MKLVTLEQFLNMSASRVCVCMLRDDLIVGDLISEINTDDDWKWPLNVLFFSLAQLEGIVMLLHVEGCLTCDVVLMLVCTFASFSGCSETHLW